MPKPTEEIPDDSAEVGGVLDGLYAEATGEAPTDTTTTESTAGDTTQASTEQKKEDEGLPADQPSGDDTTQTPPAVTDTSEAQTDGLPPKQVDAPKTRIPGMDTAPAATDTAGDETDPVLKLINEFKLKESASPKSRETFENLKRLSAEAVRLEKAAAAKLKADYDAKLAEAEKKAAATNVVPPDIEKELEELRGFKATFDLENDPAFKKQIEDKVAPRKAANYESVYGVLRANGLPESEVKALQEMSEAERVAAIGELVEKLPRGQARMKVEAKLMDNLNLDDERERAIADAREKAAKTKQEFRETPEKMREQAIAAVKAEAEKYRTNPVFKKAEITAQTPPEEKKRLEAHNATVEKYSKLYEEVVVDDTPTSRAEAALGLVLAHAFKDQLDARNATIEKLTKELADIKKRGGMNDVGKLTNTPSTTRPADVTNFDAGDSLDALARQAGIL
jgi:hypothetical protein